MMQWMRAKAKKCSGTTQEILICTAAFEEKKSKYFDKWWSKQMCLGADEEVQQYVDEDKAQCLC